LDEWLSLRYGVTTAEVALRKNADAIKEQIEKCSDADQVKFFLATLHAIEIALEDLHSRKIDHE
jgi:hypothetical protein